MRGSLAFRRGSGAWPRGIDPQCSERERARPCPARAHRRCGHCDAVELPLGHRVRAAALGPRHRLYRGHQAERIHVRFDLAAGRTRARSRAPGRRAECRVRLRKHGWPDPRPESRHRHDRLHRQPARWPADRRLCCTDDQAGRPRTRRQGPGRGLRRRRSRSRRRSDRQQHLFEPRTNLHCRQSADRTARRRGRTVGPATSPC